jgi:hypothetical protein
MKQRKGLRDWLGLDEREKGKRMQKNRGAKAFNGEVCSIYRKGIEIMVFQARGRGKEPFLYGNEQLERKFCLTRSYSL